MEVIKARDVSPLGSQLVLVLGPPGIGKSTFAATVGEVVPPDEVLLITTLAREAKSWKYQEYNYDTIMVEEHEGWDPINKSYKVSGYDDLVKLLDELAKDTKYAAVILDNGTEAGEFAWHAALAPLRIGDPNELGTGGNRFAPYGSVRENMENMVHRLSRLTGPHCARSKHVIVPWHVQPPKDDDDAQGIEYVGKELPMIRGSYRRRLGQKIDAITFMHRQTKIVGKKKEMRYVLQVDSDMDRHTKIAGQVPEGVKYIEPSYDKLLQLIRESTELGVKDD